MKFEMTTMAVNELIKCYLNEGNMLICTREKISESIVV